MPLGLLIAASSPPSSPLDPLHDPLFLAVIGIAGAFIAAVAGSAITIWYTRRQGRKEMLYRIISDTPILSMQEEVEGKIELHFGDRVVKDLRLIIAEISNSGNVPIPPEDFKAPLTFSLEHAEVLDSEVVETEPDSLQTSLTHTKNAVILDRLLLNKGNKVQLKMLVSGISGLKVTSSIVGVEIENYNTIIRRRRSRRQLTRTFTELVIALLVFTNVILFGFSLFPVSLGYTLSVILSTFLGMIALYNLILFRSFQKAMNEELTKSKYI